MVFFCKSIYNLYLCLLCTSDNQASNSDVMVEISGRVDFIVWECRLCQTDLDSGRLWL